MLGNVPTKSKTKTPHTFRLGQQSAQMPRAVCLLKTSTDSSNWSANAFALCSFSTICIRISNAISIIRRAIVVSDKGIVCNFLMYSSLPIMVLHISVAAGNIKSSAIVYVFFYTEQREEQLDMRLSKEGLRLSLIF